MQNFKVGPAMANRGRSVQRSSKYCVGLVLAGALLFAALPMDIGARAETKRGEQFLSPLIGLLLEADAIAKDASVRSELKQASEAAMRASKAGEASKDVAPEMQRLRELLRHVTDDPRGESSDFQEKIAAALKLAEVGYSSIDTGIASSDKMQASNTAEVAEPSKTQQPGKKVSAVVMEGLRGVEKDSDARADVRKKAFEADRNRFEPTATALAEALKAAGVDLDGYLAVSKQFVETSPGKRNQSEVELTNKKFAEPIRAAIAKAVGVPGVGDILQGMQSGQPAPGGPAPVQPNQGSGSGNGNCGAGPGCSTNRFEPPFEGLYSEADIGARSIRPFGETRQLYSRVRGLVIGAPHNLEASGRSFTVPATARRVSVTVNLGTKWTIGLSGVGYAHVWLGLDMRVTDGRAVAVVCSAPHLEQDNQWTWVGGRLTLVEHAPTSITRTCSFDRNAGDPTDYAVTIGASVDGTFVGFSGGYGDYYVDLGTVEVTTCP